MRVSYRQKILAILMCTSLFSPKFSVWAKTYIFSEMVKWKKKKSQTSYFFLPLYVQRASTTCKKIIKFWTSKSRTFVENLRVWTKAQIVLGVESFGWVRLWTGREHRACNLFVSFNWERYIKCESMNWKE